MPLFGAKHPQLADMGIVHYSWHSQKNCSDASGILTGLLANFS